jgi:hypothetical protein
MHFEEELFSDYLATATTFVHLGLKDDDRVSFHLIYPASSTSRLGGVSLPLCCLSQAPLLNLLADSPIAKDHLFL